MLKDYKIDKPVLETDRLMIRTLNEADVPDLKEWLGRDEIYTYWGRKANKGEKNPELLFVDARPWVKRKPSPDFDWGIVLKETNTVIGMIAVFDIQNSRMGDIGYRIHPEYWNMGITTEALKEVVKFVFENNVAYFSNRLPVISAEYLDHWFDSHVVVKEPQVCDFHQFLTNCHFSNGGIANDKNQFHKAPPLIAICQYHFICFR